MLDLGTRGFVIENEWYWRINENARTFDAAGAVRDFLAPLARHAKEALALTALVADVDTVQFSIGDRAVSIEISGTAHDRIAVNHFVGDLNRELAPLQRAFALVVPRRYELRGVLLTEEELGSLAGNPVMLVPSGRPSWRSIQAPTPV